jgi:metal-responsive CopG/Arc/MetJ family transcriptional regulator
MHALSLKLEEKIHEEAERIVKRRKISRNAYINEAVKAYNALQRRRDLREQLAVESKLVAADSLAMLKELEMIVDLHEA